VSTAPLTFTSTDGLRLEGALDAPDDPHAALVLCHPHPRMGGTMNAPLLGALRDELVRRRWAVLRFNFRGIGGSQGEPSLGEDEVADALGAVAVARDRVRGRPIGIAGWSFGGAVAIRAAVADDSLAGCVAIAPAVTRRDEVAAGLPPASELDLGVPLLVVCGARDEVVKPDECRAWIQPVEAATYIELQGANHFFWGRYDDLATTVTEWLDELL
jgi:alpha/beta superfamily hydrolase